MEPGKGALRRFMKRLYTCISSIINVDYPMIHDPRIIPLPSRIFPSTSIRRIPVIRVLFPNAFCVFAFYLLDDAV